MAPNLGWENKDLINDLKAMFDYKIYLENEAMTSAVCEKWIGDCKDDKDFICINILSGIGAGIYASNKPFRGVSGSAGEIGHITMDRNGPVCGCKNKGCLETFSSTTSMLRKAKEIYGEELNIDELIGYAKNSDKRALEIFDAAADYLGVAICYLVNTFNPSKIVLGKDFTKYSEFMINTVAERVKTTALKNNYDSVEIVISQFGEQASVLGAAILPVRKIFNI
jgi:predicted NBD/HSP70 family sugar kinase